MTDFKTVPLADIKPDPNQPRKYYDEVAMEELTASVKEKGILQPLLLRPIGSSEAYIKIDPAAPVNIETRRKLGYKGPIYLLVCGERRYRASTTAGLSEVPAIIRELSDEEALELQIIENLQRKDVHPMEEAVAFKSLIEKGKDLKEIAARVAKSVFYVRQRIKLNDLIQEWQQAYYANRINSKIAITLGTFDEKIQKEMWKERGVGFGAINIDDWFINRFRGDLKKATFALDDDMLDKKSGACINCQFNSAVASLFPEAAENPICSNKKCYLQKTDLCYDRELKKAKEDPAVLFVNVEYYPTEDKLIKALQKEGFTVLNGRGYGQGNFDMVDIPEIPSIEDFDIEDYDNEEERNNAYQDDLKHYEKELKEYENKIKGGKYKKAFCIHGDAKGKYVYIQMRKSEGAKGSAKANKEKEAAGKLTVNDITDEIKRIQDFEKRKKEIDSNKVHKAILEALAVNKEVKKPGFIHQGKIDRSIMVFLLLHEISGANTSSKLRSAIKKIPAEPSYGKVGYAFDYFTALGELSDDDIACIIRHIVMEKWGSVNMQGDVHARDTPIRLISEYVGIDIAAIEGAQAEEALKRKERFDKKILDLQAKKKELLKEHKPAKKISNK